MIDHFKDQIARNPGGFLTYFIRRPNKMVAMGVELHKRQINLSTLDDTVLIYGLRFVEMVEDYPIFERTAQRI